MERVQETQLVCTSTDDFNLHIIANLSYLVNWVAVRSEEVNQYAFYVNLYGILIAF